MPEIEDGQCCAGLGAGYRARSRKHHDHEQDAWRRREVRQGNAQRQEVSMSTSCGQCDDGWTCHGMGGSEVAAHPKKALCIETGGDWVNGGCSDWLGGDEPT